jgi:hypothetical protein
LILRGLDRYSTMAISIDSVAILRPLLSDPAVAAA